MHKGKKMNPKNFTSDNIKAAQKILQHYAMTYPSDKGRRMYPELVQAIIDCSVWEITSDDIVEAITISKTHPWWSQALSKGALTGFIKPKHVEEMRHYSGESSQNQQYNRQRLEAQDEQHRQRQLARGLDENGKPILRLASQQ